jgi:hypothetical protein
MKATLTGSGAALQSLLTPPPPVYRQPRKQPQEARSRSAQEYLDILMTRAESTYWELHIQRIAPPVFEGKVVPRGFAYKCKVIPFETLRAELIAVWGGGDYRVTVTNGSGQVVEEPGTPFIITIPITESAPKFKQYEGIEGGTVESPAFAPPAAELSEADKEQQRIQDETKLSIALARKEDAEFQLRKKKVERLRQEVQLSNLEKEINGPADKSQGQSDKYIELLRDQLKSIEERAKQDREAAEKRAKEDREASDKRFNDLLGKIAESAKPKDADVIKTLQDNFAKLMDSIKELAKKDDGGGSKFNDLLIGLQQANATMMSGITSALAGKGDGGKEIREVITQMQGQSSQMVGQIVSALGPKESAAMNEASQLYKTAIELTLKGANRDNAQQTQLLNTVLTAALNPKGGDTLTPQAMIDLIGNIENRSEKRFTHLMNMTQKLTGADEEPLPVGGDEYNPREGVGGNLIRAFFNGIKNAIPMIASNPKVGEWLMAWMNKRNPAEATDAEIEQTAQRMANARLAMTGNVPAMMTSMPPPRQITGPVGMQPPPPQYPQRMAQPFMAGQRPGQSPLLTPTAPPAAPVSSTPPAMAPRTPPVAPPVATPAPPVAAAQPAPVQPATQPATQANAQQVAASEMTGAAEGIELEPAPVAGAQPPQAMPQPPVVAAGAGGVVGVAPQQAPVAPAEAVGGESPEDRLRFYVTESMKEAISNVSDRMKTHTWPEDANRYWSGHLLDAIAKEPETDRRIAMIAGNCDKDTWDQLYNLLNTTDEGKQVVSFREAVDDLVKMHTADTGAAPQTS